MVQLTPHLWQIESEKGHVIAPSITAHSAFEAEQYVKNYITSFQNWDYKMVLKAKVPKK